MEPITNRSNGRNLTRRELLRLVGMAAGTSMVGAFASACSAPSTPASAPTSGPAAQNSAPAPTAAPAAAEGKRTDIFMQVYSDYEEMARNKWVPIIEKALPVTMHIEPGVSADAMAKMRAEKSDPKHHIMFMDSPIVTQAKGEGLIVPLDKSVMTNLADVYPDFVLEGGYGVGIWAAAMGIAYYTKAPKITSWADLWKPENQGKVSPPAFSQTNGVVFWIMAGAIKSGKTPQEAQHDPDACFAGMKDLKPNIQSFWLSDAQQMQMMSNDELWYMGAANTKGTYTNRAKGLSIDWMEPKEGAFQLLNSGTVVNGSTSETLAMQVLNMIVGQELQTILGDTVFVGPTNSKVPQPAKQVGTGVPYWPEAVNRLIQVDLTWIQSQRATCTERWNKEVTS